MIMSHHQYNNWTNSLSESYYSNLVLYNNGVFVSDFTLITTGKRKLYVHISCGPLGHGFEYNYIIYRS